MSEWANIALSDIADIRFSNVDKKSIDGEVPVRLCNYMDVYANDYITANLEFMEASASHAEIERFKVECGDVIVTKDSETPDDIGIPAVVVNEIANLVCGYHLALIKPHREKIDSIYLAKQLGSKPIAARFAQLANGSTRYGLSSSAIASTSVPLAPLAQQRRIAEILSTLDEAIAQTEALIAKHQQIKAGLMHDLFTRGITPDGHLRPTREQAPDLYKESPLGWIPMEWEVERLGDILRRCGGYLQTGPFGSQLHAHEYQVEGVPVVMPQDINDGLIGTEQIARIHEERAEELARHRMRIGDIVIARRGDLSRAAAISTSEQGWVCGTGCFLLRLGQSTLRPDYAAYIYRQDFLQRQIAATAVGTTMPSLNNTVMEALLFPFCDEDEQVRIVERLKGEEQEIHALSEVMFANRQLKHGLMHDLLTGRVRVKV